MPAISRIAHIARRQLEHLAKAAGQAAAELDRGSLATGRAADEVGKYGGDEDEGRHAQRHAAARLMDLVDDEVVATLRRFTEFLVGPDHRKTCDRHAVNQPGKFETKLRCPVKAPEKQGYERADGSSHRYDDHDPFREATDLGDTKSEKCRKRHQMDAPARSHFVLEDRYRILGTTLLLRVLRVE